MEKNKATRLGKSPDQQPTERFQNLLVHQLNPKHALYPSSHVSAWKKLEEDMAPRYGKVGLLRHPIRKMAVLLMLKHCYNSSDERVVAM